MRCVECSREKTSSPDDRGWMTVLSPSGAFRIHYCPQCVADLVRRASELDDTAAGDDAGDGHDS
ncbi:MAG: hypothetical protein ACRDL7_10210 [Gaiellaceae bacterium]